MSEVFGMVINPRGDIVGYGLFELYETHRGNVRLRSGSTTFPVSWLRLNTGYNKSQDRQIRGDFERNKDNSY